MSEDIEPERPADLTDEDAPGPSLKVAYSLLAVALVAAIGIALFIVLPFYHRH